jgi:hypothetical protein
MFLSGSYVQHVPLFTYVNRGELSLRLLLCGVTKVARVVLLEESATVGSVQSHVMQVLVSLDLQACILVTSAAVPSDCV